jgi:hypothetical protein
MIFQRIFALCAMTFLAFTPLQTNAQRGSAAVMLESMGDAGGAGDKLFKISGKLPSTDAPIALHVQLEFINKRANTISMDGAWLGTQYRLLGLQDNAMLKLADDLYDDISAALIAGGYKIIPVADIQKAASEVGFVSKGEVQMLNGNAIDAMLVTAAGLPAISYSLAMYADGFTPSTGVGMLDALKSVASVGSAISEAASLSPVFEKLGSPGTIRVALVLDFAELKSKGGWLGGGASVETKTNLRMSLNPFSLVNFASAKSANPGAISLQAPVGFAGEFVRAVNDESSVGKNLLLNAPGLLMGRGATRKSVEKTAETTDTLYSNVAKPSLDFVQRALVPFILKHKN